jgi:RNA polymerase sigma factor (sigma-70 family)
MPSNGLTDAQLLTRFVADRDEGAFAALVRRHGPMVLGVCRRVLRHEQDAEDAFQATFLTLARKAPSLRQRAAVAGWLYEVAHRTAVEAGRARARRRGRERQVGDMPHPEVQPTEPQDWRPLLDRELAALPEKYRGAVVLCDLEGLSRREAARQLGWPEGTLSSRLATGRRVLAGRLSRGGVALSGGALAAALSEAAASARVPEALVCSTAQAAAGNLAASPTAPSPEALVCSTAQAVDPSDPALMEGVVRAMFPAKRAAVALQLLPPLGACLVAPLVLWLLLPPSGKNDDKQKPREPIRVDAAAGARLAVVLSKAKPGDHFLLSGEFTEAHVFLKTQDVVIEPELGKAVVWKAPAGIQPDMKLLTPAGIQPDMKLLNVQARGCVIKGITFDGEKKATALIGLSGRCPGVRLEDLELRNFTKCGVWVTNCSGMVDNRVTLTSLQFVTQPGQAGVFFDINPTLQNGIEKNAYFAVGRFFFEGAGTKLKTPNPAFVDQPTFELPTGLRIEVGP